MISATAAAIGPYQVLGSLGAGGMGEVLLAYDPRLDRQVAIKRIRPEAQLDPLRRARFRREARLAAKLHHSNIVRIFDLLSEGGVEHIVMEHIEGRTLKQTLRPDRPMDLERALTVSLAIARGLAYAHGQGIIHRDLKSENVLLGPDGEVKIADFGIACRLSPSFPEEGSGRLTRDGQTPGTVRAMAPEQLRGTGVGFRSDLFAFGALLYEMLAGRPAFRASTAMATATRILEYSPPSIASLRPEVPDELSALVDHLLEKEPTLRPRDAREVAHRLRDLVTKAADTSIAVSEVPSEEAPGSETLQAAVSEKPPAGPEGSERLGAASATLSGVGSLPSALIPRNRYQAGAWVLALGLLALGFWLIGRPPTLNALDSPSPLHVAVPPPQVEGEDLAPAEAFLVRSALLKFLAATEAIYPATRGEMNELSGSAREIGRAVAADEVVEVTLRCRPESCQIDLALVELETDRLRFLDHGEFPRHEPLVAARVVQVLAARAYRGRATTDPTLPEVSPEDYSAFLEIHRAFGSRPRNEGAGNYLEDLAALRARAPGFVEAPLLEAKISLQQYSESGDEAFLSRARRLARLARTMAPAKPEIELLWAHLEIAGGNLEAAGETLDRLEASAPGNPEIPHRRAELLFAQGDLRGALVLARNNSRRHPSWRYLYRTAALASRLGETDLARQALGEILRQDPDHYDATELLARAEMIGGNLEQAAALYQTLVDRGAGPTELGNLGNVLLLLGRPQAAVRIFDRLLAQTPTDPRSMLNLADAQALAGKTTRARQLYSRIVEEVDPALLSAGGPLPTLRAQALAHLGRKREAVATAHGALQKSPDDAHVIYEAALVFAIAGEGHSALAAYSRATELGFDAVWFRYPWFEPLRSDPDFERRVWKGTSSRPEPSVS